MYQIEQVRQSDQTAGDHTYTYMYTDTTTHKPEKSDLRKATGGVGLKTFIVYVVFLTIYWFTIYLL